MSRSVDAQNTVYVFLSGTQRQKWLWFASDVSHQTAAIQLAVQVELVPPASGE